MGQEIPYGDLLTAEEAADFYRLRGKNRKYTVMRWARLGKIRGYKLAGNEWRFTKQQLFGDLKLNTK